MSKVIAPMKRKSMLKDLFSKIEKSHTFELTDNPFAIDEFEKRCGYKLPEDLKEFYRRYKTVKLFDSERGATYRFVNVNEIKSTGFDIYGVSTDPDEFFWTRAWFTVCDVLDGNYIAVDLSSRKGNEYNFIDCFHETYGVPGESQVIAKSFRELLERSLENGDQQFYLKEGFKGYGDTLEITPETAIRRMEPVKPKWGWLGEIIRRAKYPHIQSGWYVEFVQPNNSHQKFFGDRDYGSKEKSLDAAKKYLYENLK
jgi:antitoxin YokJ